MAATKKAEKVYTGMAKQYRAIQYDPTMLQINMLIKHSSMTPTAICNKSGVSRSCLTNWMKQKTRRPQAVTMRFVLRTLGYDLKVVPTSGHNKGFSEEE